jgi:uncharacterized integral membrane protein (TIGR00698 family)
MMAAGAIAAIGMGVARIVPVVGAPVIAILCGIALSSVRSLPTLLVPGITFTSKRVLQASVVVLGFDLSLSQLLSVGLSSLPVLIGTLLIALTVAWLAGRALRLGSDLRTMIGVGTAICGASAIAAADAVIEADEADVSYAIATIFTFNVVAVLLYPVIGLSQHSFGLWAGTAINDVSSVVAASTTYGHAAGSYAVIVKLTRTLAIIPICVALAVAHRRSAKPGTTTNMPASLRRIVPLFVVAFVFAVAANSAGLVPHGWHSGLSDLATWMITAALAAIGASADLRKIRAAGVRPLLLGAILWATVGVGAIALQAASGKL